MTKTILHPKKNITKLRQMLPAKSAAAHTIERREPWGRTDHDTIDDGSTEFDDDLVEAIEACVQRGACYEVTD